MSNFAFDHLFTLPAIPAQISGKNDVAIRGGQTLSILFGQGNTPEMRGAALLAAIAESAFDAGGKAFQRLEAKGAKKALTLALQAGTLPACKGGKTPAPLMAADVESFIAAMRISMGEVKAKAVPTVKLPDLHAFIEKHGKEQAHAFAVALLGATSGTLAVPVDGITVTEEQAEDITVTAPKRVIKAKAKKAA